MRAFIPRSQLLATWGVPAGSTSERKAIVKLLHKVAMLVTRLDLSALDVERLYPAGAADPGGLLYLDLQALPMTRPGVAAQFTVAERARFSVVLRLADLVWLRNRYPAGAQALFDTLSFAASAALAAVFDRVSSETGFGRKDVEDLANQFGLTTAASFRNEAGLYRIAQAVETLRRVGSSAAQAIGWLAVESPLPTTFAAVGPNALTIAREIKSVARARHVDAEWDDVARPLRNPLRDRQRQALAGALLDKLSVVNSDRLFETLLIDVDMSPCAITSRLVSAHGSVQTFTTRILLNLEPNLPPTRQLGSEWEWMRAYRVWEANRKVFLWPENWIEPELRDDKTPLFEDLETALLQGPLTDADAEAAYHAYLDGLADIAVPVHRADGRRGPT